MSIPLTIIPKRELLAYQADIKGAIFRQIRHFFNRAKEQEGFTQKHLAKRIDMDEGQLSRRLRGDYDLKLETLSDLARGLECRIDIVLTPLADIRSSVEDGLPEKIVPSDPKKEKITAKIADAKDEELIAVDITAKPHNADAKADGILSAIAV